MKTLLNTERTPESVGTEKKNRQLKKRYLQTMRSIKHPDVKYNDGIYSRYFTSFSVKGTYTVSVSAELRTETGGISFIE
ncbi:hypothetical protein NPIL_353271, partial [Nephila pilipes]